jgi:hypothetical protein
MSHADFSLAQDEFGRLVLTDDRGETHVGVVVVRAFPIAAPEEGISLLNAEGHELAWIDHLTDLPDPSRRLLELFLATREFMPVIRRIESVSSFATPSTWHVETDRGMTDLILRGEEDIRRLGGAGLLIADTHGIQYLVRDLQELDAASRRLLDRFL